MLFPSSKSLMETKREIKVASNVASLIVLSNAVVLLCRVDKRDLAERDKITGLTPLELTEVLGNSSAQRFIASRGSFSGSETDSIERKLSFLLQFDVDRFGDLLLKLIRQGVPNIADIGLSVAVEKQSFAGVKLAIQYAGHVDYKGPSMKKSVFEKAVDHYIHACQTRKPIEDSENIVLHLLKQDPRISRELRSKLMQVPPHIANAIFDKQPLRDPSPTFFSRLTLKKKGRNESVFAEKYRAWENESSMRRSNGSKRSKNSNFRARLSRSL